MLQAYMKRHVAYYNEEMIDFVDNGRGRMVLLTEEPKNESIHITWDNLEEMRSKYGLCLCCCVSYTKKGRVVNGIKEWKTHSLNMRLNISYKSYTPSIKEILDYRDSDKAIQYLVERGLKINE